MSDLSFNTTVLTARFSSRLRTVLNNAGYPTIPLDRARLFSHDLDLDVATSSALLNGFMMPEWSVLLRICALTNFQPGYFLDDSVSDYPPDTRLVKPLTGGDTIVLRMPESTSRRQAPMNASFSYLTSHADMGFEISKGDSVVNYSVGTLELEPCHNQLYLFGIKERFEIWRCFELTDKSAVFVNGLKNDGAHSSLKITMCDKTHMDRRALSRMNIDHFGEVTAVLRDMRNMPTTLFSVA